MARDYLGLFDTPPDQREIRLSLAVVGLLLFALFVLLPLSKTYLGGTSAFVPVVDAFMLLSELIIATLLYAQAAVFRSRALTILASGYLFAALLLVPQALTFPGAFSETGLLGAGVNTTAWLAIFRRTIFPLAIITYALLKAADSDANTAAPRSPARIIEGVVGAIALAASATILATTGHDLLPAIFLNTRDTVHSSLVIVNLLTILLTVTAMGLLLRHNRWYSTYGCWSHCQAGSFSRFSI